MRRAFSRAELTEAGDCAIEGVRILEEAIRSGLRFHAVFFSESAEGHAKRLLPQIGAHVETAVLPDKLFASVVPSETPQGVAALVRYRQSSLEDLLAKTSVGLLVVVSGLQDPGNLGTILRSAEAFSAAGVVLGEGTVSPFNSKVVRGSAGSLFRLPVVRAKVADLLPQLREKAVRLVATSSHKGVPLPQANLGGPVAVLIGGEGAGISKEVMTKIDEVVAIPHAAQVESLNAGVAASIVLYEIARQKLDREI
ncbi:MAG TPA: RNA methyltransferase [Terriglobales bacterium]|nr:RNA methyltransferase [Terriglobales bacterium]